MRGHRHERSEYAVHRSHLLQRRRDVGRAPSVPKRRRRPRTRRSGSSRRPPVGVPLTIAILASMDPTRTYSTRGCAQNNPAAASSRALIAPYTGIVVREL